VTLAPAVKDVMDFHLATTTPIRALPSWPSAERVDLRVNLIVEEVTKELLPAIANRQLDETADAIVDSIYVLIGAALEFGIPLSKVWQAVQDSNMAKAVRQPDGTFKVLKRADNKVLKPEGWQPPDVRGILIESGWDER
jgi:predicted HAD superfamily Cof-like phosphohydrolase